MYFRPTGVEGKKKLGQRLSKMRILSKILKYESMETNQIGGDTGIDKAALCWIIRSGRCNVETADILLKYFGSKIADDIRKS
jgi:hypothetical protein